MNGPELSCMAPTSNPAGRPAGVVVVPPGVSPRAGPIDVSVVVVNYNTHALLEPMRRALDQSLGPLAIELIVIDNASRDGSGEVLQQAFADALVLKNDVNVGFGRANNQALPHVRGRYVLLLNTDAFVAPDTLAKSVEHMDHDSRCGIVGVRLEGRDGELQPSCRYLPTPWNTFLSRSGLVRWLPRTRTVDDMDWGHDAVRACDWVPGCYLLVRREVIDKVGLFDPRFFMYFEEVDLCAATRAAGWEVHFLPGTTVVHLGGESAKADGELTSAGKQISALQVESELLYFRKHFGLLGSVTGFLLSLLCDALLVVKHLLRGRPLSGLKPVRRHQQDLWTLAWRTGLGRKPTR